jgi:hypothetical protein
LKNRSLFALVFMGLFWAAATLALTGCRAPLYYYPQYEYAGRTVPPSGLLERVMVSYTSGGSGGGLEILDGLNDLRGNKQDTIKSYSISGYSNSDPLKIINYPEQTIGYVLGYTDGSLTGINYSKESTNGLVASFGSTTPSGAATPLGTLFAGAAEQAGQLVVSGTSGTFYLNLPNVYKVAIDPGAGAILAMVRNSNSLYRVVKLPSTTTPITPPGSVDCEPLLLPVYCVVPVAGNYDRPSDVSFSLDGSTAYVLNCGPECGGTTASVSFLQLSALNINLIPTVNPLSVGAPSPLSTLPVANPVPIPGGVTAAVSDGTHLYLSGQSLFRPGSSGALGSTAAADGLFTGYLSVMNLTNYTVGNPVSISDGTHTRMLLADDDTLWVGSSQCASGERQAVATQQLATTGSTTQAGNYNCLTMVNLSGTTPTAQIIPAVVQSQTASSVVQVPYPNTNQNLYYYGSLTGLCWVQNYHKVYTAYGGQVHAFRTTDGSEINNFYITVQGTAIDVAYMDALTNGAN